MIVVVKNVFCDGNRDACCVWEGYGKTAAAARAQAKRLGWVRRKGKDLCPSCAKRLQTEAK